LQGDFKSDNIRLAAMLQLIMIFSAPPLTDRHQRVLAEVSSIRDRLKYSLRTPRRWDGILRRSNLAKAIRGSNSIEGYEISQEDAIAAVEGEEPLDATRETWAAIQGYRDAMTYVLALSDDPFFHYGENLIRSMHFMMLKYDLSKNPGRWRPGSIFVRDEQKQETVYEGPDVDLVRSLMKELVDYLNDTQSQHALIRAAMGHLNLAMIHPFSDGNGRMARCIQTLVLAREGILQSAFCSIEEYLGRNTPAYYYVLAAVGRGRWSPQNDTKSWIEFCLTAHYRQANTIVRRVKETERLWDALEQEIERRKLPERTIYAVADAAIGLKVRNATYRNIAEVSDFVASRDFKQLVECGLIMPDGERRGRFYIASPYIREIRRRTREPRAPSDDPFDSYLGPYLPGMEP
jgi:Fic family protein